MKHFFSSSNMNALLIMVFIFSMVSIQAQTTDKKIDSIPSHEVAIKFGEISDESEKLGQKILKLKNTLKQSEKIADIDSIVGATSPEIIGMIDSVFLKRKDVTLRDLKVRKVEWNTYKSVLSEYQGVVKNRTEEISKIIDDVVSDLKRWELTKKELEERSDSKDIAEGFNTAIESLEDVMTSANDRLDNVFVTQKKITDLVLIVDEEVSNINLAQLQRQKDYFALDASPIWKTGIETDEFGNMIDTDSISSTALVIKGLKENKKQFIDFYNLNIRIVIFQVTFLILMLILLIVANRKYKKRLIEMRDPIEIQAKLVMSNPVFTTMSVGVLISAFFYGSMVPAYSEFHILIVLFGTVLLLPKLTSKKFRLFLWLLYAIYILNTFEAFIGIKATLIRWLLILDAIVLVVALNIGRNTVKANKDKFSQIIRLFRPVSVIYMILLGLSIVANIIGMVALSSFIAKAVLFSMTFGMIIYLAVKVFISFFILIFKLRKSSNIQTLTVMVKATHQRIRPMFNWIGLFFWLFFTLTGFELYNFILEWIDELMAVNWRLGEMNISLGGILAFVGIFILTMIISKISAALFQDEWMVNVLPRGIAPAISLVLRIVVVGLGLYAGLSAAGVDLSKLGFIIGALGVGIGFGLQNVVLNFVSGLILAFERPINLGDAIEVDMEKGVVTSIGVRSSNIRTYSGAEVIVPNGDLISKKVINYTLSNRNRRSKIAMRTSLDADPEKVIELFNQIASDHPNTSKLPAPKTYFYGYEIDGNLSFALLYWTTFSDTLKTDSEIALKIFKALKEAGIEAPAPVRRIIKEE